MFTDVISTGGRRRIAPHRRTTWTRILTFTVSRDAPSRITTSLRSAMRSCRLRRCLAGLGSYSSKCSRPRFFPAGAAMLLRVRPSRTVCVRADVRVHEAASMVTEARVRNLYKYINAIIRQVFNLNGVYR